MSDDRRDQFDGQATAVALVVCPDPACKTLVEVPIPVRVWVGEDSIGAEVDNRVDWEQPIWDHTLNWHGPKL